MDKRSIQRPQKDLQEVTGKIRGEAGTSVEITIERNGQEMSFTVQREEVHITYVTSRMLANNIGYIKIDEFSGSALEEYQQAVAQLQEQGMQAMILDLRDNPGGFVGLCSEIADELLPQATIISVRDKNGNEKQIYKLTASRWTFQWLCLSIKTPHPLRKY